MDTIRMHRHHVEIACGSEEDQKPNKRILECSNNLVGGGLTHGYNSFDNMVKEAGEEGSLDPEFVSNNLKSVGIITFYLADSSRGWIPDTDYLHALEMPETMIPTTQDGEVEQF
ncbi:hypothetical protein HK098_007447 [Nowakowskiella sp. JEL0407]|nr:hypothetical protein HK098_007447 [Nowakowskiella sp. JEL0407]